jgi:diadenosine tetraphosphatase ApaH/serine/threonine PP2A family protein phosphatase
MRRSPGTLVRVRSHAETTQAPTTATKVDALATRVAVISDVHANWQALQTVLEEVEQAAPDELWCLGDLVGYGPRPNPCCAAVEQRAVVCLAGNHDLGVLGVLDLAEFADDAVVAARWTRAVLAEGSRVFLQSLRPEGRRADVELFHASPRDPVWEYVLSAETAATAFELTEAPLVLVGHSHVPLAVSLDERALDGGVAAAGSEERLRPGRRLLNPGSVGQPRDGDARAAWLLLDTAGWRAQWRRIEYDVAGAAAAIRAARLPDSLAERLEYGQ